MKYDQQMAGRLAAMLAERTIPALDTDRFPHAISLLLDWEKGIKTMGRRDRRNLKRLVVNSHEPAREPCGGRCKGKCEGHYPDPLDLREAATALIAQGDGETAREVFLDMRAIIVLRKLAGRINRRG